MKMSSITPFYVRTGLFFAGHFFSLFYSILNR